MKPTRGSRKEVVLGVDLAGAPPADLLKLYACILDELRKRKIVRSTNNPVADYAETLAVETLGLVRAPKSTTGFDAFDKEGMRYEIKARRVTSHNKSRQLSVIRGLEKRHFTFLVGMLFREDFSILRVCLVPHKQVKRLAKYREHVNGWILQLTDDVWQSEGVQDITSRIRATAKRIQAVKYQ
jgi:hypothetical protein